MKMSSTRGKLFMFSTLKKLGLEKREREKFEMKGK